MKWYLKRKWTNEETGLWEFETIAVFTGENKAELLQDAARQFPEYAKRADEAVKNTPPPQNTPVPYANKPYPEEATRYDELISWAYDKGLGIYNERI